MAVALRSTSRAASSGGVGSIVCPIPAGVVAGDVLLMLVKSFKSGGTPATVTVAGWTVEAQDGAAGDGFHVLSRFATGTEGANVTVALSASGFIHVVILAYSGASGVNAVAKATTWITSATPPLPSVTTTVADAMVVGAALCGAGTSGTPAAGWTEQADDNAAALGSLVYAMGRAQAATGASPAASVTVAGSGGATWTYAIALAPARFSWRAPATGRAVAGGGLTIDVPLIGFSVGDLMLVALASQNGALSCTPPAGWTEVHDLIGASAVLGASYYRVKDGSEGSTATFTFGADAGKAYAAAAVYDPAGALTVGAVTSVATATDSGNTGISLPAVPAPGASGYLGVAFACPRGQSLTSQEVTANPTGWTKVAAAEPIDTNPLLHPTIFIKEKVASGGETPSGGVWNANNYEANAVIAFNLVVPTASTDSGSGAVTASGSGVESHLAADAAGGTVTASGSGFEGSAYPDSATGIVTVSGSGVDEWLGPNPSGVLSKIKWGTDLVVTDEGAGVIRVDVEAGGFAFFNG